MPAPEDKRDDPTYMPGCGDVRSAEPSVHLRIEDDPEAFGAWRTPTSASAHGRTPTFAGIEGSPMGQHDGESPAPTQSTRSRRARRANTSEQSTVHATAGAAAPTLTREALVHRIAVQGTAAALSCAEQANNEGVQAGLLMHQTSVSVPRDRISGSERERPSAEASTSDGHTATHSRQPGGHDPKDCRVETRCSLPPASLDAPATSTTQPSLHGATASSDSSMPPPRPPPVESVVDATSDRIRRQRRRERRQKRQQQLADAGSGAQGAPPCRDSEDASLGRSHARTHMRMTSVCPLPLPSDPEGYISGRDRRVPGFLPPL